LTIALVSLWRDKIPKFAHHQLNLADVCVAPEQHRLLCRNAKVEVHRAETGRHRRVRICEEEIGMESEGRSDSAIIGFTKCWQL
jgi:hypothetical protein